MMKMALTIVLITLTVGLAGCAGKISAGSQIKATNSSVVVSLINLSVEGADYRTLTRFKEGLKAIKGVKKVYQLSFSADKASLLRVEYEGVAQSLANSLQNMAMKVMRVEILQFNPTGVSIRINSKPKGGA
ncbi:MAG: hypothetical protein GXP59_07675 [Deltaproteobacteria bacterium]|nr:hypothetical protein [Deltaproteobacteria bacterium]